MDLNMARLSWISKSGPSLFVQAHKNRNFCGCNQMQWKGTQKPCGGRGSQKAWKHGKNLGVLLLTLKMKGESQEGLPDDSQQGDGALSPKTARNGILPATWTSLEAEPPTKSSGQVTP